MAEKLKLYLFWKQDCPKCPEAKRVVSEFEKAHPDSVKYFDVDDLDGSVEARLFNILGTPSTFVVDEEKEEFDDERVVKDWRGVPPDLNILKSLFTS